MFSIVYQKEVADKQVEQFRLQLFVCIYLLRILCRIIAVLRYCEKPFLFLQKGGAALYIPFSMGSSKTDPRPTLFILW